MILARQFVDVLIAILLIAAVISLALGEISDALTILVIVLLNGLLGFVQEWKAGQAIEALQQMLEPHCKVIRDGHEQTIDAKKLVPGDIVCLATGDHVPGDLRLTTTLNLRMDESSLTGESTPVSKNTESVDKETVLAETQLYSLDGHCCDQWQCQGPCYRNRHG